MTVKVHLTSIYGSENPALTRALSLAAKYSPRGFQPVGDADRADMVACFNHGYLGLRSVPEIMRSEFKQRIYVYSETDWPFPFIPGLYPSITRTLPWANSWSYLLLDPPARPAKTEDRFLFSFLGRAETHRVRRDILRLDQVSTPCIDAMEANGRIPDYDYTSSYLDLIDRSLFVLCPRGFGTSSIRIFECMRAGRVPVIVSDDWTAPPVGQWAEFSVRVRESDVASIPRRLEAISTKAREMGRIAQAVFEENFSPSRFLEQAFNRMLSLTPTEGLLQRTTSSLGLRELRTIFRD